MTGHTRAAVRRPLVDYYDAAAGILQGPGGGDCQNWEPRGLPPTPPEDIRDYLAVAEMRWLPAHRGAPFAAVLDLRSDSETQTTKLFPSLLMVARAVNHIRTTGEAITIVTPSSANKASALRHAVELAFESGLVDSAGLRIISVVPRIALPKFRSSGLVADEALRTAHPLFVYDSEDPADVKLLVRDAMAAYEREGGGRRVRRVWQTLKLDNYAAADAVRADFENDVAPPSADRIHAHAVSSAYGLIGYGRRRARLAHGGVMTRKAGYLLIQHMFTSDMVRALTGEGVPVYENRGGAGHTQDTSPHWPSVVDDVSENMEATFYTKNPPTAAEMRTLANDHFGTGIVVSRRECLDGYDSARDDLGRMGIGLPLDPGDLREWAAVMGWTGCERAVRRGLLPPDDEVVLHCSGSYAATDYTPLADGDWMPVEDARPITRSLFLD
jgi:hypothetical protein